MVSQDIETILNDSIEMEFRASHVYLQLSSYAKLRGFEGTSSFLRKQSEEEREHALKLISYMEDRDSLPTLKKIENLEYEWLSLTDMFETCLLMEKSVTENYKHAWESAFNERDFLSMTIFQEYLKEQIEEEAMFQDIIDKFEAAGNTKLAIYQVDRELLQ